MLKNELTEAKDALETEDALDIVEEAPETEDKLYTAEGSEAYMVEVKFPKDKEPEDINVYEIISQRYRDGGKICSIKDIKDEFRKNPGVTGALKDLRYSGDILIAFGHIYPIRLIPAWKRITLSMYRWLICSVLCLGGMLAVNAVLETRQFDGVVDTPGLIATKYFIYALAVICILSFTKALYNSIREWD